MTDNEVSLSDMKKAVRKSLSALEGNIKSVQRKRSWRASEKVMALVDFNERYRALRAVQMHLETLSDTELYPWTF
jgi:hypothetical protein